MSKHILGFVLAVFSVCGVASASDVWYFDLLNVTNLHAKGMTGAGVKVGVVDSGIQPVVTGSVTNMALDHHGGSIGYGAAHGISVASIIKSDRFGIVPDCEIWAYNGSGMRDDVAGMWWCATNGCRVINFSGGYTPFDGTDDDFEFLRTEIRKLLDYGVILVVGGGNAPNETLTSPQDIDGVINIAGIKQSLESANLNDSWAKDFAAFGNGVQVYKSIDGTVGINGGTSFAAPMATSIIALFLQQNPNLTREEVYYILKQTCRKLTDSKSKVHGWGLLQACEIPADYKTQAEIDAEKMRYVKMTGATLNNNGLIWNNTYSRYEIKMYPGETHKLRISYTPENSTDTNVYWYCGNVGDFNRVGLDNLLTVPSATSTGKFLVYVCRNAEREILTMLKVTVVVKGSESEADVETLTEKLAGKLPEIASYVDGAGDTRPAFCISDGEMSAAVPVTVEGIYYTPFVSNTLDGTFSAAQTSALSCGEPIVFELEMGSETSKFLLVVASDHEISAGTELQK